MSAVAIAVLSYLFGAIPTGYLLFRWSERKDIRKFGSRSIGATNVLRLKGWKYGAAVVVFDFSKGFLPVYIASRLFEDPRLVMLCGLLTVIGHCYPVFIKFKGGKGVATTVGVYAAVAVMPLLIILILFLIVVLITRYVSLSSLLAAMCYPPAAFLFRESRSVIILGLALFALIAFQHRSNIHRLIEGNEHKIGDKT